MKQNKHLVPEKRATITEIQDLLIERYVEQSEAIREDNRRRAIELEFEIKQLLRKKNQAVGGCLVGHAGCVGGEETES